jgi:hypothetical protein
VSFSYFPEEIPAAKKAADAGGDLRMTSEPGIEFRLRWVPYDKPPMAKSVLLAVLTADEAGTTPQWTKQVSDVAQAILLCEPRGIGETLWTTKGPPNYVARSHALLGRTVDAGRVWDVIAAARNIAAQKTPSGQLQRVMVAGKGSAGIIAAYAAALEPSIVEVRLVEPTPSLMDKGAPQFLNALRVCDVPDLLGLLAPRPLRLDDANADQFARTKAAYEAAGATDKFEVHP